MFKVGDRVEEIHWNEAWAYDQQGEVIEIHTGQFGVRVRFDNDKNGEYFTNRGRLRLKEEIRSLMPPPPLKDFM